MMYSKTFLILFFLLGIFNQSFSQCNNLTFSTQAELDAWATANADCTDITENVYIGSPNAGSPTDISDLSGLQNIQNIVGTLSIINNPNLTSLNDLQGLLEVGHSIEIVNNAGLMNLNGLENISLIEESFKITNNASLTSLEALQGLSFVGSQLEIKNNDALNNLQGLGGLGIVTDILLEENDNLESLAGLENLGEAEIISINNNAALQTLAGLDNLYDVYFDFSISNNESLVDLSGMLELSGISGSLNIINNASLSNLTGLENVNFAHGLYIQDNQNLVNLEGLTVLEEVFFDFQISGNESLTSLAGMPILAQLDRFLILNNSSLTTLSGLQNLNVLLFYLEISGNDNLLSLAGLEGFAISNRDINIINNSSLTDLTGLDNVVELSTLTIRGNSNLQSLSGLGNLLIVDNIFIENNDALFSLNGMSSIIGFMTLQITGNEVLNNIAALETQSTWLDLFTLSVYENPNLGSCSIFGICELLTMNNPNNTAIDIRDNGNGCNSNSQIEAACSFGEIIGSLSFDEGADCILDNETIPLEGWKIIAESPQHTRITFTDSLGEFELTLLEDEYVLTPIAPNEFWQNCSIAQNFSVVTGEPLEVNFFSGINAECPFLEVELGAPLLRRCFDNYFTINWNNQGAAISDAYIEIFVGNFIGDIQSAFPFTINADGFLVFQLGEVNIGDHGNISFSGLLSCEAELGQVVCLSASIYPQRTCTIDDQTYEGAALFLEGRCDTDSLYLFVNNSGLGDMVGPSVYRLYKNAVLIDTALFTLAAGETFELAIPVDGCTYRLETDQVDDFPLETFPSYTIEDCRIVGQDFAKGFFLMHRVEDYGAPFHRLCLPAIGAYDPNDKQGFPLGFGDQHFIEPTQEIEYLIRFQNTGSDTAFNIVVLDTLSENFDLTSLELGTSSHPLKFAVIEDRTLEFSFENIMLPDSNVNQLASNGFFKYKVKPVANLPIGTTFENSASIYFDFNAPVKTNTTFHSIGIATIIDTTEVVLCEGENYEGITYAQNAVLVDTLAYSVFENISLTNIEVIIPTETVVDTLLEIGMLYNGIVYETDTTFQEILIDQYGCDSIVITNVLIQPVSTFDLEKYIDVTVSPNPFREKIQFEIKQVDFNFGKLELYDALGKNILTKTFDRNTFELEGAQLMQGIYFYRIILDGKYEKSGRVVKE